jgi:16S rRNA (uracil1498-N3)-methyltransferase
MTFTAFPNMTEPVVREPLFYCADLGNDNSIRLSGDEAHHVAVQRLRRDDAIALFDGCGRVARGTVALIGRHEVRVAVQERRQALAPVPRLDLYCAVPKGDRITVLLDMATQLGMARFTPVSWQRSVTEPRPPAIERWRRVCLEACKQSKRLYLPEICDVTTLPDAALHANASGAQLVLAHPSATDEPMLALGRRGTRFALFVGPEGGVTEEEAQQLQTLGAGTVRLGAGILRIETAAIAMLALASLRMADYGVEKIDDKTG